MRLAELFRRRPRPADLTERAGPVAALLARADDQQAPWAERAAVFDDVAGRLMELATMSDDVGHLDRLLHVGDGVITSALLLGEGLAPPHPHLIAAYLRVAEAQLELFEFRMRATDLRKARTALRTAAALHALRGDDDALTSLRCAAGRARLAAYRAETFGAGEELAAAVAELRTGHSGHAGAIGWLARCLRLHAPATADPVAILREAIELLLLVVRAPLPPAPILPWLDAAWGAELVHCQLDLYAYTGEQTDLNIACNWARDAYAKQYSSTPAACATARAMRTALGTEMPVRPRDVQRRHEELLVTDGRNWHGWLLARGYATWCRDTGRREGETHARYAYDLAMQVAEAESGPAERRAWLRVTATLAPLVTDRLLAGDVPAEAAARLERGRALILRERFADDYAELRDVTAAGLLGLAADLREALDAARSDRLGEHGQDIAATRLLQVSERLRGEPGFAHFRGWPLPAEVAAAAGGEPLVYLLPGPTGGWIVGHDPDRGWFQARLPLCRTDEIPAPVRRFRAAIGNSAGPAGERRRAVTAVAGWLWDAVYVPMRPFAAGRTIHVVAHGYLAGLPVHAARPTGTSARGALHESGIRYVPSARALAHSRRTLQRADPDDQVFLGVPPPGDAGLPAAEREVQLAVPWFPRADVLRPEERSPADVARAAQTAGWLHASCHGVADTGDPLRSGLELAGGERLTLGRLARASTGHLTLAVLSACQTAVADPELPDEELSLAAGFLSTGCGAVVASAWPVADQATAALMTHFYRAWRGDGRPPAEALRAAQLRLAETGEDADGTPVPAWREPYYWAGFRYLGW